MTRSAFVTGGTGFLGWHIADQLLNRGWAVTALHRPTSNLTYLKRLQVALAEGEITDRASLERAMPEGVDAVFHVAADTSTWSRKNDQQTRTNVEGTRNMVEVALAKGAGRFIQTSSISAYGRAAGVVDEATPSIAPTSFMNYERTKWLAEQEVRKGIERGLDAVMLNPTGILGPGDTNNWARSLYLAKDGKIPGAPPGGGPFCDVREVARVHIEAVDRGETGSNYLLGGESVSYADLLAEICRVVGREIKLRPVPGWVLKALARVNAGVAMLTGKEPDITPELAAMMTSHTACDATRARRDLGFEDKPWRQSLRDSYDWLVTEGLI